MKNRTGVDFSKNAHRVEIFKSEEGNEIRIDHFQVGNSYMEYIKFMNTDNNLFVSGDFGCWTFERPFIPSEKFNNVSDYYWLEKLQIATGQKIEQYDSEKTAKLIEELIETGLEDYGYEGEELAELKEWYKELLTYVDDEYEYVYHAYRDYSRPNCLEHENIPFGTRLPIHLEIIFDAFEEICERLRNAPEPEVKVSKKIRKIGVISYSPTDFKKFLKDKFETKIYNCVNRTYIVDDVQYICISNILDVKGVIFDEIIKTEKSSKLKDLKSIMMETMISIRNIQ